MIFLCLLVLCLFKGWVTFDPDYPGAWIILVFSGFELTAELIMLSRILAI